MYIEKFVPNELINEDMYIHMDMIQTCYDALNEDVVDRSIVDITRNNTLSLTSTYLEVTYKRLLQMHDIFTSYLNNYILNYTKLSEKYKTTIIDMYGKINEPIIYSTFAYPKQKEPLPRPIANDAKWYNFIRNAQLFGTDDSNEQADVAVYFNVKVNEILQDYTKSVVGKQLHPDKLAEETKLVMYSKIKGPPKTIGITQRNVGDLINGFNNTAKEVQKDIKTTKSIFSKDYKVLQDLLSLYQKNKVSVEQTIAMFKNPEKYELERIELKRFSNINMEMNRLYLGLITVYNVAYTTKYEALRERIELDRAILVALLKAAGSFAAINNKTATKQSQPLKKVDPINKFQL